MGDINSKGKSKITVQTSEDGVDGVLLSPGFIHFDREARVEKLILKDVGKTSDNVIIPIAEELFLCSTYGEVLARAEHVAKKLEELDCFKKVDISVDSSKAPDADPKSLEVTLKVEELGWIQLGLTCLETNNEEDNGGFVVRFPNLLGGAEKVEVKGIYRLPSGNTTWSAVVSKPLYLRGGSVVHFTVFKNDVTEGRSPLQAMVDSSAPDFSYRVESKGFRAGVSFNTQPNVHNVLAYQADWRDQTCEGSEIPDQLRQQCGSVFKSSILHKLTWEDSKPHAPGLPEFGSKLKLKNEFAGVGGDLGFLKSEVRAENSRLLLRDLTGQIVGQAGIVFTPHTKDKRQVVFAPDKFFLGGPNSVRGFERRGIVPQDNEQGLGSDIYYAGGLHLYYRVPSKSFEQRFGDNFRLHGFTNFGSCTNFKKGEDNASLLCSLGRSVRLAIGMGLSFRLGECAQAELNVCQPYNTQQGDIAQRGMQFGIGVNFL